MKRQTPFNLVEILLALGVVAIGICSIMVLFPVGVNANKDAAIDTDSSNIADQALHFVSYMFSTKFSSDDTEWSNHYNYIPVNNSPDHESIRENLLKGSSWYDSDSSENSNSPLYGATWFKTTIYENKSNQAVYQIIGHRNADDTLKLGDDGFEENVDFRAIMVLTRSQIVFDENLAESNPNKYIDYRYGFRLTAEISWPAERPYAQRKVTSYSINIYRNN